MWQGKMSEIYKPRLDFHVYFAVSDWRHVTQLSEDEYDFFFISKHAVFADSAVQYLLFLYEIFSDKYRNMIISDYMYNYSVWA